MCLEINNVNDRKAFLYKVIMPPDNYGYIGLKTFLARKDRPFHPHYIDSEYKFYKTEIGLKVEEANNSQPVTTYFYYKYRNNKLKKDYINHYFNLGYHVSKISDFYKGIYCSIDNMNKIYFNEITLPIFFLEKEIQLASSRDVVVKSFVLLDPEILFEKEYFKSLKTVLNVIKEEEFIKGYTELFNRLSKKIKR